MEKILSYIAIFLVGWLIGFGMVVYANSRKGKNS